MSTSGVSAVERTGRNTRVENAHTLRESGGLEDRRRSRCKNPALQVQSLELRRVAAKLIADTRAAHQAPLAAVPSIAARTARM